MQNLDVITLKDWLDSGKDVLLLDVRDAREFEYCNIEGSVNLPLSEITDRVNELGQCDDIVLICHHGARSMQAGFYMENAGIKANLYNLEGGIDYWADQIDGLMPRY